MDVVSYEFGSLAIDFCLSFNFAVVFSSIYFRFANSMSIGDAQKTVRCALSF